MWFSSLLRCNTIFYIVWNDKWNCRPGPCMTSLNLLHGTGEKYCSRVKKKVLDDTWEWADSCSFSLHVLKSQEIIKRARSYPKVEWESCLCHCWTDGIRALLGHSISPYVPYISEAISGICLFFPVLSNLEFKNNSQVLFVPLESSGDHWELSPSAERALNILFYFFFLVNEMAFFMYHNSMDPTKNFNAQGKNVVDFQLW